MRAEFRRLSSTDDCAPREGNYLQVAGVSMTGLGLCPNAVDLSRYGIWRFGGGLGFLAGDMGVCRDRSFRASLESRFGVLA